MPSLDPFRLLLMALAGWMNQQQRDVIDYLQEENCVLYQQLGNKQLRLTDDQRRCLAAKAKKLGPRMLQEVTTIPDEHHFGNTGTIQWRERMGEMLNYYYRDAA